MRTLWLLFLVGLAVSEKMLVSSQSFMGDDIYIEGQTSGELPIDDEDGDGSGSGSGDYDKEDKETINITELFNVAKSEDTLPTQSAADSARNPTTKVVDTETTPFTEDTKVKEVPVKDPVADLFTHPPSLSTTSEAISTKEADEDNSLDRWDDSKTKVKDSRAKVTNEILTNEVDDGQGSRLFYPPDDVTSESMWERTEVLAAVIACVVVGLLCAIFLLVLLAYRMKKKDEGSYDLGDTKLSTTAYQKAPTKEFYA
ncbi:syndecan-2-like [Dunckerocampus dactyliophorus]|uniref:syndecan-2-like n=1 Tax=Dunckerocampus dactyliophorus TaxID=161453 RepID=UPI002407555E|nr:syndecan-2-like [Dunckerocampus dactyliophorus]